MMVSGERRRSSGRGGKDGGEMKYKVARWGDGMRAETGGMCGGRGRSKVNKEEGGDGGGGEMPRVAGAASCLSTFEFRFPPQVHPDLDMMPSAQLVMEDIISDTA